MTLSSLSAQDPEAQLNLQHVLGKPNIIRPQPGDLVLLCAQRVSGVDIQFNTKMMFLRTVKVVGALYFHSHRIINKKS